MVSGYNYSRIKNITDRALRVKELPNSRRGEGGANRDFTYKLRLERIKHIRDTQIGLNHGAHVIRFSAGIATGETSGRPASAALP